MKHAVFSSKGYTPFRVDNKWGLKAKNCRIILQPVYDSILNGGLDYFIVVKEGKYELLNKNFWSCLDEPAVRIAYDFKKKVYTVEDKNGMQSDYEANRYGSLKLKSGYDHSKYLKPPSDVDGGLPRIYPSTYTYYDYCPFVDSVAVYNYSDTVKVATFYPNQEERWSINMKGYFSVVSNRYLKFWSGNLIYMVDIRSRDTVFQFSNQDDLEQESLNYETYYLLQHYNYYNQEGEKYTLILDENLDTILQMEGIFEFKEGYLYGYHSSDEKERIYTFPDQKFISIEYCNHDFYQNFLLANPFETEHYRLYYKDKLIKTFDNIDKVALIEHYAFGSKYHVTAIEFRIGGEVNTEVYDSTGRLLWKGDNINSLSYSHLMNQLSIDFQGKNGELDFKTGVYDTISGEFRLTPFDRSKVEQIGANFFVCHDNDSVSVFRDLKGNRLDKEEYTYSDVYYLNFHRFLSVHNANVAAVYKDDFELICDSCYIENFFNFIHGNWNQFIAIRSMKDPLHCKVYDENGKTPLKKDYLVVYFHHLEDRSHGYFVALNDKYEIEYIQLSEIQQ